MNGEEGALTIIMLKIFGTIVQNVIIPGSVDVGLRARNHISHVHKTGQTLRIEAMVFWDDNTV
jgi:hypothetical protein